MSFELFSKNTNMNTVITIGIVLLVLICYIIYNIYKTRQTFKNQTECKVNDSFKNNNVKTIQTNQEKILKYFGSHMCPHSKKGSRAYNIIKEFEEKYDDIEVQYYWSGDDNSEEFKRAKAQYVPTITNNNYETVKLVLPPNTDTTNMDDDILKELLLENMLNQL